MRHSTLPRQISCGSGPRLLAALALLCGTLVAACGGGSHAPTGAATADAITSTNPTTTTAQARPPSRALRSAGGTALAFSACMRANGVPSFPDPTPGGRLQFQMSGAAGPSPAFGAAEAKCRKLLPLAPPGPGSSTHPSAGTLAKLVRIAECMRRHGVPDFPDPRTTVPAHPTQAGVGVITDFDGVILLFPRTLDLQAPAYRRALTECGAPPLGLPH